MRLALKVVMQNDWDCGDNPAVVHVVVLLYLDL